MSAAGSRVTLDLGNLEHLFLNNLIRQLLQRGGRSPFARVRSLPLQVFQIVYYFVDRGCILDWRRLLLVIVSFLIDLVLQFLVTRFHRI